LNTVFPVLIPLKAPKLFDLALVAQQTKLAFIDVTRGLAILGVLIHHFVGPTNLLSGLPQYVEFMTQQGAHGVQLFFIASAFTLFRSYQHRSHLERHPVRNFFLRRYFRIAPMYYLGIAYYLWQNGAGPISYLGVEFYNSPQNILANISFLNGFNPYFLWLVPGSWSVATEICFYLLVPMLFKWIPDLASAIRLVGFSVVLRVVFYAVFKNLHWVEDVHLRLLYANWVLPTQLVVFSLGILLFFILRGDPWPKFRKIDYFLWSGLIFVEVFSSGGRFLESEVVLSVGLLVMILGLSKLNFENLPGRVLAHIGKISFSLYLSHWAVIYWLDSYGLLLMELGMDWQSIVLGLVWRFALVLGISVLISTVTYQLVEKQGQKLGKWVIGRNAKM
jgi:peptidoglycan/LPS O-acetylase OafA/YrhL